MQSYDPYYTERRSTDDYNRAIEQRRANQATGKGKGRRKGHSKRVKKTNL